MYKEAKSQFIKKLIKGTSWRNKARIRYIDDLITLEKFILEGPKGFASGMLYGALQEKYKREWEIIYKELKPEQFKRLMEEERLKEEEFQKKMEQLRKELKEREERLKREWHEMGGTE